MSQGMKRKSVMISILGTLTVFITSFVLLLSIILRNKWYSYIIIMGCVLAVFIGKKFKVRGLHYAFICITSIGLAFTAMICGRPDLSISFTGNLINNTIKEVNHIYFRIKGEGLLYSSLTKQNEPYVFGNWSVPDGYVNNKIELSVSNGYLLSKKDSDHKKVVYQLHGGGYVGVFNDVYNQIALQYSKCYDNADVFSIDYRTAPDNLYPSALEDAVEGYIWLLENGYQPENIIVCGDSAGGGLALALSFYLRDNKINQPQMLILCSPWTDLSAEGETYQTKILEDPFFGSPTVKASPRYPVPIIYAGKTDLHNPYLSPAYGNYEGMPPMLIQTGSNEILLSDSVTVVQKAKTAGVEVLFKEYNGMFHTFYTVMPQLKESKAAWKEIKEFVVKHK